MSLGRLHRLGNCRCLFVASDLHAAPRFFRLEAGNLLACTLCLLQLFAACVDLAVGLHPKFLGRSGLGNIGLSRTPGRRTEYTGQVLIAGGDVVLQLPTE